MKLQSPLLVGLILLAALLQTGLSRPPKLEGQFETLEHFASPQWAVELTVTPDTVAVGDIGITVTIRSARSSYLTLL